MCRFIAAVVVLLSVVVTHAQTNDHLTCFKVRDPAPSARYAADLDGLVIQRGCVIKVPAVMACVPTTKSNVEPNPPGGGGNAGPGWSRL